jgi:hypothetical protein
MGVEGSLVSKKFINLLIRQGLPANAQLVLVDSLTGDILYPYDVSNYYGNVEMGFTDLDGELYFANQSVPKEVPGNQGRMPFDAGDISGIGGSLAATGKAYEFPIVESVLNAYKDNTSTRTRVKKLFDPSDANSGWRLDWVQLDDKNDPAGPALITNMNKFFYSTFFDVTKAAQRWTFRTFDFDPSSGKATFTLLFNSAWVFLANADYLSAPGADPSSYLRFTWDVMFIDQVRNIPKSRGRYHNLMGRLPKI